MAFEISVCEPQIMHNELLVPNYTLYSTVHKRTVTARMPLNSTNEYVSHKDMGNLYSFIEVKIILFTFILPLTIYFVIYYSDIYTLSFNYQLLSTYHHCHSLLALRSHFFINDKSRSFTRINKT